MTVNVISIYKVQAGDRCHGLKYNGIEAVPQDKGTK
jgi:hypothetical protein